MSNTIDRRVVEMGFDNQQFEAGVQTSVKSLDNLKKGLNLDSSTKSLNGLSAAGKSFSLQGISDGVEQISRRFSALGIMGATVLANLTNSAIRLGTQMIQNMAIAPLKQGLQEYETQLNAIQTVLANTASKGTTLTDVSKALDELNTYADKTIYNFTEMTRNIGTFTAAGVALDTSVQAIKGIANLAAVSGSNAQQASTAMYQLSQAMASGTVKLMDWNSVVNAGMGGQVFQDALKETARVHKVNIDQMIKTEGSFRETLSKGWLTTQILTETLAKFTGDMSKEQLLSIGYTEKQAEEIIKLGATANDAATKVKTFTQLTQTINEAIQSGWAKSWQIVLGDFEEAKSFWTDISNLLGKMVSESSDSRNNLLQSWKDMGGRTALIYAVKSALEAVVKIIDIFKKAWGDIFPPTSASQIMDFITMFVRIGDALKINSESANKLGLIFKGVASVLDIGKMAVESFINTFGKLFKTILPTGDGILDFASKIGIWLINLRNAIKYGKVFDTFFEGLLKYIETGIAGFKNFLNVVKPVFDTIKEFLTGSFSKAKLDTSGFDIFADKIKTRFSPLTAIFDSVGKVMVWIGKVVQKLSPLFFKLSELVGKGVGQLGDGILKGLDNLDFNKVFDVINGGLLSALILAVKKFIDNGSDTFSGIKGILDGVQGSLTAWQENLKAKTLMQIAISVAILAASLIALSMVDSGKLTVALTAISVMFGELMATMAIMDKIPGGSGMDKVAASMLVVSAAVLVLSFAVSKLAKLSTKELMKGLIGVGIVLTELSLFMKTTNLDGAGAFKGVGLVLLATSLVILANAVKKFGDLDPTKLALGLGSIGVVLAEVAIFSKTTGNGANLTASAVGLVIIGAAMLIFSAAVEKMGSMSWETLGKGLGAMGVSLLIVAGAMRLMPGNMIVTALGLLVVAASLTIVGKALKAMGGMSWDEIGKGLATLAASLGILALAMYAMEGGLPGAAAMLVMAAALAIFVPVLQSLGSMSLQEIAIGVGALAAAFVVIGVAGLLLGPLVPVLIGLSGAMLLFGLACVAVGIGVLAFSAGLAALAVSGAAGAAAVVVIVSTLLGIIPMIASAIAQALIDFAAIIITGAPIIGAALLALLQTLIQVIVTVIPEFIVAIVLLLTTLLDTLAANMPRIIQSGFDILMGLLNGILNNISKVVNTAINIVITFINTIASRLPDIIKAGWNLIISFIDGLTNSVNANLSRVIQSCVKLGVAIIEGIVKGVTSSAAQLITKLVEIAKEAWEAAKNFLGINSPSKKFQEIGEGIAEGWVKGVDGGSKMVVDSVDNTAKSAIDVMSDSISEMSKLLSGQMDVNPTIRPVVDLSDVISGGKSIDKLLGSKKVTISSSLNLADRVSSGTNAAVSLVTDQPSQKESSDLSSVTFNQYNYSPKELSRLEIFRQTNNQLTMFKRLVRQP